MEEVTPIAKNLTREAAEHGRNAAMHLLQDDDVMDVATLNFRGGMELVRRGCDDTIHRRQVFEQVFFLTVFGILR